MDEKQKQGQDSAGPRAERSPWELAIAAASLLVFLGMVAFLGYEAWGREQAPARLGAVLDSVRSRGAQYAAYVTVANAGDATAAEVQVLGELRAAGSQESSQTSFDFVPAHGRRQGTLLFSADPRKTALQLRVLGYREP